MTEEPHRSRRMAIMKAHPEVSIRLLPLVSFSVVSRHGWTFRTCQTTHKSEFELFSSTWSVYQEFFSRLLRAD